MHVMAVAGRRIDAAEAEQERFPLAHVPAVRLAIANAMRETGAEALVCSAACGTDLIALDVAEELGIPAAIVLPFDRERFRELSVVDRPGDWGPLFDHHMDVAERRNTVYIMPATDDEGEAYLRTSDAILDLAVRLARNAGNGHAGLGNGEVGEVTAVAVWDGASRGPGDVTEAYISEARQRGIPVRELAC